MTKKRTAGMTKKRTAPWKRPRPKQGATSLTANEKRRAKSSANRSGRRYPNLVDNMQQVRKRRKKRSS